MKKHLNMMAKPRFMSLVLSLTTATCLWAGIDVNTLRTESLRNPVGIDAESPSLSWIIENNEQRGVKQTAYEVEIFSDRQKNNSVWNSGRVESDCSDNIRLPENIVDYGNIYWWKVTVWDNYGNQATSDEDAYFELGLPENSWNEAEWIKATEIKKGTEPVKLPEEYSLEADIEIENLSAGLIFGGADKNNYFMWQINFESGYPRFRPHSWRNGQAACLAEIDLRNIVDIELHKTFKLKIEVKGNKAITYVNDTKIDERENPYGEKYIYGNFGIRQDRALHNYNDLEKAYFDNFKVYDITDNNNKCIIDENFSSEENRSFTNGTITDDERLYVVAEYSWYQKPNDCKYKIEMDFNIQNQSAGIIFSSSDVNNHFMWAINVRDNAYPILRRHVKNNGTYSTFDVNLSKFFKNSDLINSWHHIVINVEGNNITTIIDDKTVDTYTDNSGLLIEGEVGFRAYLSGNMNEVALYDNINIYTADKENNQWINVLSDDFENGTSSFVNGEIYQENDNKCLKVYSKYEEKCIMQNNEKGAPLFRKIISADSEIKSAKIYASALGVFDLFVNGNRVGHKENDGTYTYDELKPGWTDYRNEIAYMTYDITDMMKSGKNIIGAQVSNGWWAGNISRNVYGKTELGFIAIIDIVYENGKKERICTNTDWESSFYGPLKYGDIYNGEIYDARKDNIWNIETNDSYWYTTAINSDFKGKIIAYQGPCVRIRKELQHLPKSITVYNGKNDTGTSYGEINVIRKISGNSPVTINPGETALIDLGQNITGWVKMKVKGNKGVEVKVRHGEMLNDKGDTNRGDDGPGGSLYTYNLRTARATVNYILKGDEEGEVYSPSSSFFGFRYCEITATDKIEIISVCGEVVGSELEETAKITTSSKDINQLYSNIMWSQRDNFLSIPTDCPQRDERLGWTGDTQIFSRTACYNAQTQAFYHKWMRDLRNSQREDGAYPDMAPYCNFWGYGNAAWGDAGVIVPWNVYLMYGDKKILEDNYESMTLYMNFLEKQSGDGFKYNGAGTSFGDWLAYEELDKRYVSVCYYAYVSSLMSKIAKVLSANQNDKYYGDIEKYNLLYDNIRKEFRERYLDSNGTLKIKTQTAYLLALNFGLLDKEEENKAISSLRSKITNNGYKLSTGFVGTGILNQTLSMFNQDDMAYNLLLQRNNPSWLYSVDQGATTIWERWDSYTIDTGFNKHPWNMNSFNHYSYGAVAEWIFRFVGGIETDESNPGFKHFILQPTPDYRTFRPLNQEKITWADISYKSRFGYINSYWNVSENGTFSYNATIPANTTATLYLPVTDNDIQIYESGIEIDKAEGVTFKGVENGKAIIELVSGCYSFTYDENNNTSVKENIANKLKISPNPFDNHLFVYTTDNTDNDIEIRNSNGLLMFTGKPNQRIETLKWPKGMYIIKEDNNNTCIKAIKQ